MDGVDRRFRTKIPRIVISPSATSIQFPKPAPRAVIALGKEASRLAQLTLPDVRVVVGAVFTQSDVGRNDTATYTLVPDPTIVFGLLKQISPNTRRVYVLYDKINSWTIKLARDSAKSADIELIAIEIKDVMAAAKQYREIFSSAVPDRDAVWLLHDPTSAEEESIVPWVVEECWNRSLALFSNNASHAKKGALFSVSLNNEAYGQTLAAALSSTAGGGRAVYPLRDVYPVINIRTAEHLELANTLLRSKLPSSVYLEP